MFTTNDRGDWSQHRYVYILHASKSWQDCKAGVGFWPMDVPSSCFLAKKLNLEHSISTVSCRHNRTDLLWCDFSFMVIWKNWIAASISAVLCFLLVDRRPATLYYLYLEYRTFSSSFTVYLKTIKIYFKISWTMCSRHPGLQQVNATEKLLCLIQQLCHSC